MVPGFIAEMLVLGQDEHSASSVDGPDAPGDQRPWRRLKGDRAEEWELPSIVTPQDAVIYYYSGKSARDTSDVCKRDFHSAMQFFGERGKDGGAVLDLGCGDGLMARRFAQSDKFDYTFALDISHRQLEAARWAAERERTGPEDGLLLGRADAQALPFGDSQVDAVWWGLGMHIVGDPAAALREIFRVLRPGSRLVATTLAPAFTPQVLDQFAIDTGFQGIGLRAPRPGVLTLQALKP